MDKFVILAVCLEKWHMKLTCLWTTPTHYPPAVMMENMAACANAMRTNKLSRSQDGDKEATQTVAEQTGGVASDNKMNQQ